MEATNVRMMKPGQDAEIEVSWDDQSMINKFSRLNSMFVELEAEAEHLKKVYEGADDAENELELVLEDEDEDDDPWNSGVPMLVGETFVNMNMDDAKEKLQEMKEAANSELAVIKEKMLTLDKEMNTLKGLLYTRFGDSIQLERE